MIISQASSGRLVIPNLFDGVAGRQGAQLAFWSATLFRGATSGAELDGEPVRLMVQPDPSFSRRAGGLLLATILAG